MKFISTIDFDDTKASNFFIQSGLCFAFATAVNTLNIALHIHHLQTSVLDNHPTASLLMNIMTSDTVQASLTTLSSLNLTSYCVLASMGIVKLIQKNNTNRSERPPITNPWQPSV